FPARNVGAAATLRKAGADTVPAPYLSAGQANSSAWPDPSARREPAKSNSGADAKPAASDRLGGIRGLHKERRFLYEPSVLRHPSFVFYADGQLGSPPSQLGAGEFAMRCREVLCSDR